MTNNIISIDTGNVLTAEQRHELANASAERVLEVLDMTTPPFDPFEIARRLGVQVHHDFDFDDLDKSGYIHERNGEITIWINPIDHENRQNFTMAHELGHLILHILTDQEDEFEDTPERIYHRSGDPSSKEYQANAFAGELLMPNSSIIQTMDEILEANGGSMPASDFVSEMAPRYGVSKAAMTVRLKVLGVLQQ